MDLSKMTARVRHNADGSDAGSGMLTVEVGVDVDTNEENHVVTSHSHSAEEIVAAYKAGMQVRVLTQTTIGPLSGDWIFPLVAVAENGSAGIQLMFINAIAFFSVDSRGDDETWLFQMG